jgi:predicted adenylyl cyclase CyaB
MSRLCANIFSGTAAEYRRIMRNLEAKFRMPNHSIAYQRALTIGFEPHGILIQHDRFFLVPNGKLKLREQGSEAWLIHYRRDLQSELQLSDYTIVSVAHSAATRTMLTEALGLLADVRKHRTLMMRRNVRLHLDRVEGLGDFGEIEAVLADDDAPQTFREEVTAILNELGIASTDLIERSYFELIGSQTK